ncbi:DUF2339 domain-containing protein [Thalassotalea sp. SU-HH00458]|uniref:DUF2339 domain-containing protein n=1 Tax=Thalassotalea sp. SU-HH00458 TaxID=3127657 RepID=UPI0033657E0E
MMNEEVKALKSELALLKLQFSERVNTVEARLNKLLEQKDQQQDQSNDYFSETIDNPPPNIINETRLTDTLLPKTADEYLAINKTIEDSVPAKPSFITVLFQAVLSLLFDWFSPITKIYQSYKERGMLGIFILTITGIGLTLAGFGYLMQLLIDHLGAGSKSLLMCFAAILVMGVGVGLKLKTRFGEFATAIVTLGILLSYSTVYFSGSVYGIIPNIIVLLLYLFIALVCHGLAQWLDIKIVAGLGVIGISTMPILSNTIQFESLYYLLSLAFVITSSLILAYKRSELWLANLSLAFFIVALEWLIGVEFVYVSAWIINLFYLLFFTYIVITLFKNSPLENNTSNHKPLILLAALVSSTVLLFFQSSEIFSTQVTISFSLNTIAASVISILFYKIRHKLTHFFILLTTLWSVLAVASAISDAYWGIAWAVEGILLLYIGRKFEMTTVVNQSQVLIALALVYCWSALAKYFPLPALKSIDGWLLSIVIVAVIGVWHRVLNNSNVFDEFTQKKIKPFLQLLEVVWLSILLIASLNIWLGNWTGATILLLQLVWLFRAKQCKQLSIEVFAATLILVPLFYAYSGGLMVNSYRFTALPLFAKFSIISAFIQLWLWSEFYRKFYPDSALKDVTESARILFYLLLPVCWVNSSLHRLNENVLMILWFSPLLALFLAKKIKHQLIVKETKLLTALSSVIFILLAGQLTLMYSIVALTGFIVLYSSALYFDKKVSRCELCEFIISWGVISLGFSIPSIIGFQSNSLLIGLIVTSFFWISYLAMINVSEHLRRNTLIIMVVNGILVISAWSLTFNNAIYACIPVMFLIAATDQKKALLSKTRLGLNSDLFLHSIAAITYVTLFSALVNYRLDLLIAPTLAVHGALILFMKDRRTLTIKYSFGLILLGITKLALFDAANALLWHKVILFMGIGVFILVASFWYQKLTSKTEP